MVRALMGRLSKKSCEELLALLEQLVQRQPDIEPLIELLMELPLATTTQERSRPGKGRERTLDPSTVRSQVASAFYHAGEGWGAASRVAAEEEYPGEAIRLYKSVIQKLIDGRGRENYQQAIGYMMRIRMLYQKQGQESEWQAFITNLRNSNKSLRALKEELDKREL
jgi:hypothetical protein